MARGPLEESLGPLLKKRSWGEDLGPVLKPQGEKTLFCCLIVFPDYNSGLLVNVPPSVGGRLEVKREGTTLHKTLQDSWAQTALVLPFLYRGVIINGRET